MIVLLLIVFVFAAFIGLLMEVYKKKIRKDKAKVWEIKCVALIVSFLFGIVLYQMLEVSSICTVIKNTPWLIIPSGLVIYLLQRPVCMSFWKPLIKKWMERKLR